MYLADTCSVQSRAASDDFLGDRSSALEQAKGGCYLNIEASPGSKSPGISGIDKWRGALKIGIASPPVSGKASRELIGMFEIIFPEVKGRIVLVKGEKSHSKRLFIPLDKETIRVRLGLKDD